MKNILKTTVLVFALGTLVVFANGNTPNAHTLSIKEVLPATVTASETPAPPEHKKARPVRYSPEQKASIVELKLNYE